MAPIFLFLSLILVRVTVSQVKLPTYASFPIDGKTDETQGPGSEATSEPKSEKFNLEKVREFEKMYKFCKEHMDLAKSSANFAEICEYLICFVDENDPDCSVPVLDTDGPCETTLAAFNCANNPYDPGCWITTSSTTEGPGSSKTPTTIDPCIWNPWYPSCRSSITTEEPDEVKDTTATVNNCVINPYDPGCWNRTTKATTGEPKGTTTQTREPEIETTTDKDRVATTDEVGVNCPEEYEWFCEGIRGLANPVLNGTKVSSSSEHDVTTGETIPERVDETTTEPSSEPETTPEPGTVDICYYIPEVCNKKHKKHIIVPKSLLKTFLKLKK